MESGSEKRGAEDDGDDAQRKRSRWGATEAGGVPTAAVGPATMGPTMTPAAQATQFLANPALQMQVAAATAASSLVPAQVIAPAGNASGMVANRAQNRTEMESRDSKRLFVGNLPPGLMAHELHAVFTPLGALGAEIPQQGKSFGFVQFDNGMQAQTAMTAMDGFELAGRRLRVSRPHNSRIVQQQQQQPQMLPFGFPQQQQMMQQQQLQQQQMLAAYQMVRTRDRARSDGATRVIACCLCWCLC